MSEKVSIDPQGIELVPCYGGMRIVSKYTLTHRKNFFENKYLVTCHVSGVESRDPQLITDDAVCLNKSNDETLKREAVMDMFEDES